MQGLGDLPGGIFDSRGFAVSSDGSIVVGRCYSGRDEAFMWTASTGMAGLGDLPGEPPTHGFSVHYSACKCSIDR